MKEQNQQNTFRELLKSEVTWLILIVSILWGGVQTVVLPLQKVQIQIASVQTQLLDLQQIRDDINVIQQEHKVFIEQQKNQDSQIVAILKRLNFIQ